MARVMVDPLQGLEDRPIEAQVAVLANEVRNQRNTLSRVDGTTTWILRTLVALLITVVTGLGILVLTTPRQTPQQPSSTVTAPTPGPTP